MGNGLTQAWLSSSLSISPLEQIEFLQKFLTQDFDLNPIAYEMTKHILFLEDWQNGWQLYGKTGNCLQSNNNGKQTDKQIGWFVGWIEKDKRKIAVMYRVIDDQPQELHASLRARDAAKSALNNLINRNE